MTEKELRALEAFVERNEAGAEQADTDNSERGKIRRAFAACICELRHRIGLAQEKLAWECGIDRAYFGQLERARHTPTLETIMQILAPLETDLVEFARVFLKHYARESSRKRRKTTKS